MRRPPARETTKVAEGSVGGGGVRGKVARIGLALSYTLLLTVSQLRYRSTPQLQLGSPGLLLNEGRHSLFGGNCTAAAGSARRGGRRGRALQKRQTRRREYIRDDNEGNNLAKIMWNYGCHKKMPRIYIVEPSLTISRHLCSQSIVSRRGHEAIA